MAISAPTPYAFSATKSSKPAATTSKSKPAKIAPTFDGKPLKTVIDSFRPDDVATYGIVSSTNRPGHPDLWLLVNKDSRSVYYHLSDTKEPGGTNGSYKGYRILAKVQFTTSYYPKDSGADIPLVGTSSGAHGTVTARLFVNETLLLPQPSADRSAANRAPATTGNALQTARTPTTTRPRSSRSVQPRLSTTTSSIRTGSIISPATTLIERGTLIQTMRANAVGSPGEVFFQAFTRTGEPVTERTSAPINPVVAYSGTNCADFGDSVEQFVIWGTAATGQVSVYELKAGAVVLALLEVAWSGGSGAPVAGATVALASEVAELLEVPFNLAAKWITGPFYGWVAEAACNAVTPTSPTSRPGLSVPPGQGSSPRMPAYGELICLEWRVTTISEPDYVDEEGILTVVATNTRYDCIRYGFAAG